jgi:hypothetical protein
MAGFGKRFGKHKWWVVTALLSAPLVAVAAGVPNIFAPNTVISSAAVNANFANLADRVTALEAAQQRTAATVVMDNVAGPLGTTGKMATFTTSGGAVVLVVAGTGFGAAATTLDVAIQVDGITVGHLKQYVNEGSSHRAFPTRAVQIPAPAVGSHTLGLLYGNTGTSSDFNDSFSVTAIELGH